MKTFELEYIENTKSCVWVKFESIEFYWETGTRSVLVKGDNFDTELYFKGQDEAATAKDAKRAVRTYLENAFGV